MKILKKLSPLFISLFTSSVFAQHESKHLAENGLFDAVDSLVGTINGIVAAVLFETFGTGIPLAVIWLVCGGLFFTIYFKFISIRGFKHAIKITKGDYDHEEDQGEGEVTHFQALTTALSATVGLGNIAGVAIAVSIGGPGATFWMIMAGVLGMSLKFAECTLAQMYRVKRSDGHLMGGAMTYLSEGFKEKGWTKIGSLLAIAFCVLCIGGSMGGGNAFQVNQSLNALSESVPFFANPSNRWVYGLVMSILVGIVIIGGIKRIASTAEKIVPAMCAVYVTACLYIIFTHLGDVPTAFGSIFAGAFSTQAAFGGMVGALVQGFKRAAFSNEAGMGSAAIAHSAAKTKYPVREGYVATLEPFVDTIVVCTMTALVIIITGSYSNPEYADLIARNAGASLTSKAFGSVITWFPYVLSFAVVLFAYSTMISWSYYGERCWTYLFGEKYSIAYKLLFVIATFFGSVVTSTNVLDFSDLMILSMAFPNLIGVYFLAPKIKAALTSYEAKLATKDT